MTEIAMNAALETHSAKNSGDDTLCLLDLLSINWAVRGRLLQKTALHQMWRFFLFLFAVC